MASNTARSWLVRVGMAGVIALATAVLTPAGAGAQSGFASSGTSAGGGWGTATWHNDSSSERRLQACDEGDPDGDGLRAIATLTVDGVVHTTHAAGGVGTCNTRTITGLRTGASYTLTSCLRNGASGSNRHCSNPARGVIW